MNVLDWQTLKNEFEGYVKILKVSLEEQASLLPFIPNVVERKAVESIQAATWYAVEMTTSYIEDHPSEIMGFEDVDAINDVRLRLKTLIDNVNTVTNQLMMDSGQIH